jgi:hypothetical protein
LYTVALNELINMSNVSKYKCNMIILSLIENELFLTDENFRDESFIGRIRVMLNCRLEAVPYSP